MFIHRASRKEGTKAIERNAALATFACLYLALWPILAKGDAVTNWNAIATTVIAVNAGENAPATVIAMAYVHAAIYDSVNAIDGRYPAFAVRPTTDPKGASEEAATAAASYNVLKSLYPSQQAYLDTAYAVALAQVPAGTPKDKGIAVGTEVAQAFLSVRAGDGRNAVIAYTFGDGPGVYQATPPAYGPPILQWLAFMRPFALLSPSQFRAYGPPDLTSARWARDFNEVKEIGALNSATRTPKQTEIAQFYLEHAGIQFARNMRAFAATRGLSLADNARLFGQLYVAGADALIACFDSKYHFNFWRPVTAIRDADTDGNDATEADPDWLPLLVTPAFPEYVSAHATFTTAYAETLRYFFHTKKLDITLTSTTTNTAHTFHNTDDIIEEIINARVYGGLHYRTSDVHGSLMGKKVAQWVSRNYFRRADGDRDHLGDDDYDADDKD